jgi:hypothetical protein
MPTVIRSTVHVQQARGGRWEVALPDRGKRVPCETFDDAKRIGYQYAARSHPCELIVHDAYHRVLRREVVDDEVTDSKT